MPVVPTPPTIRDGIIPASVWNQFRDAIRFLQDPPIADLRQAVAQNITNFTWTALTFDVADLDTDVDGVGGHSTSSNTSRYTAQYSGWYKVSGGVGWATNATGVRGSYWAVNGVVVSGSQTLGSASSAFESCYAARGKHVYIAAGDYVELFAIQNSGGTLATSIAGATAPNASIRWVHA